MNKLTKPYFLRFWHCWWFTIKERGKDHRQYTEYVGKNPTFIGCCCGKGWYGKSDEHSGVEGTNTKYRKTQKNA